MPIVRRKDEESKGWFLIVQVTCRYVCLQDTLLCLWMLPRYPLECLDGQNGIHPQYLDLKCECQIINDEEKIKETHGHQLQYCH